MSDYYLNDDQELEVEDMSEFKDLSGDLVYDHIKKHMIEGNTLMGALVEEPKVFTPHGAKKVISVKIKDHLGKEHIFTYNYNKLSGELKSRQLRGLDV